MNIVRNVLRSTKHLSLISVNYFYDYMNYVRSSKHTLVFSERNRQQIICEMIKAAHSLEKGLSFKDSKPGFGLEKIKYLVKCLKEYTNRFGVDIYPLYIMKVIKMYYAFNSAHLPDNIKNQINEILTLNDSALSDCNVRGGSMEIENESIYSENPAHKLITNRVSVREFTDQDVDLCRIDDAIMIAQKAPSACNRQSVKVYVVSEKIKIQELLSFQNGNRGFTTKINKLLILTADLNYYGNANERNLSYIDCGIFSMALLLSLNSLGVASCALNWASNRKQDKSLKRIATIPSNELIGLLIGVGYAPKMVKVPVSWRKPINDVRIHI